MKIVFMGTPDFATGALEALVEAGHEVVAVVTQPDKRKGRSGEPVFPPVKECAVKHNIPVFQPERIKRPEAVEVMRTYQADLFVVAAFGQILSKDILEMPKYGCINIHASLLPKYRGAAPIQWSILNGDAETGVTIMQMNEGLDTGDILTTVRIPLTGEETGESLFDTLSEAGAKLLVDTIPLIERGEITPVKQDEEKATHVGMLTKEMGKIDWTRSAAEIERQVRGMNSWPSAYCELGDKTLKIWKSSLVSAENQAETGAGEGKPGEVIHVGRDVIYVAAGRGVLALWEVQLSGKKRMSVRDFLLGCHVAAGDLLR